MDPRFRTLPIFFSFPYHFFSPTIRAVALHDNLVRVSSGDHEMGSGREFAGDSPYVNNPCVCGHAPLSSYFVFFF